MARCKDWAWNAGTDTEAHSVQHAQLAVLMDIRDELKELNTVFSCRNTRMIPALLRRIAKNTTKPEKKVATKKRRKRNGA